MRIKENSGQILSLGFSYEKDIDGRPRKTICQIFKMKDEQDKTGELLTGHIKGKTFEECQNLVIASYDKNIDRLQKEIKKFDLLSDNMKSNISYCYQSSW